jgi:hypothetical protein
MMNSHMRWIVVLTLLFFCWKGVDLDLPWPPRDQEVSTPRPAQEFLEWSAQVRPIAAKMLPTDRVYLSNLYEAMSFILLRDFDRDQPIIKTTDDFVAFHAGTLRLAIDKASVGKYSGLAEAIDQTFLAALGADQKALDDETKPRLIAACGALSWTFGIGKDE